MDLNQLKKIEARLKQVNQSKVEQFLKEEILANGKEIVKLVRDRWKHGKRPDGDIIGSYASFSYELFKRRKNPLGGGRVDLILDGGLNEGLVVNHLTGALFNIFSTDEKAVSIASKYGLDVYGLTKEEEQEVLFQASIKIHFKISEFVGL